MLTSYRYKHLAEKAQRQENVMEKYKKKLQEGADLRQQLKVYLGYINVTFALTPSFSVTREAEC
jgi:hypothetical protein